MNKNIWRALTVLPLAIIAQPHETKLDFINKTNTDYKFIIGTPERPPRFVGTHYRLPKNSRQVLQVPAPMFRILLYEDKPKPQGYIFRVLTGKQSLAAIRLVAPNHPPILEPQTHFWRKIPENITAHDISLVKSGPLLDLIAHSESDDYELLTYLDAQDIHGIEDLFSRLPRPQVNPNNKNNALIFAAKYGKPNLVLNLIMDGADPNSLDAQGHSVFYHALRGQQDAGARTVGILIDHGANINSVDGYGFTPLMRAAQLNKPFAVELLLQAHADSAIENQLDNNKTACDYATNHEIKEKLCK